MKNRHVIAVITLPLAISGAFAQEGVASSVKISGFGTGALTWTNRSDAEFARPNQASGAGTSPRTGVDSNLGLQADYQINDWLSVTGQGLARKGATGSVGADATLAFVKFKLNDTVSVRAGRVPMAVFMISDYRNVGYANVMLRPNQEVYSQVPHVSMDGADVSWQKEFGETTLNTQFAYGRSSTDVPDDVKATVTESSTLNFVLERGPVTLRFGRNDAKLQLKGPFFSVPKTKVSFTGAGLAVDWKNVVVLSEYTRARGFNGGSDAWYAMAGYRFGTLLPYISHGKLTGATAQNTDSIGLRWDAFRSAAIKFQIDRVKPKDTGLLVHAKPGFSGPVTVGAVAVDFVF